MQAQLTTTQLTQINSEPFYITDTKYLGFPMAPLVTVLGYIENEIKKIKIRTTLFIDSSVIEPKFGFVFKEEKNTLFLTSDYKFQEDSPKSFNCYYVELDYYSKTIDNLNMVTSFLCDLDPKISRGTSTSVLWS